MTLKADPLKKQKSNLSTKTAAAFGIFGALAMASCCILPLVLFSLGATGVWIAQMGALYQYKWYFFAFAGGSLAYGFYKVYWRPPQNCRDVPCARPVDQRFMKTSLWLATLIVATSLVFPYVTPYLLGY